MLKYALKRLLLGLPVILGVCTITFLLIHLVPGDPVEIMLGDNAQSFDKEALRQKLGLDLPVYLQYFNYLKGLVALDLGLSLHSELPVFNTILQRLPATVELTFAAMMIAALVGLPLGLWAAVKQYSKFDNSLLVVSLLGISLPGIFLGPMLIWIFAINLDWFPVSERGGLEHLFLPALSLAIPIGTVLLRMTRVAMLEEVRKDYLQVAKAKGLSDFSLYFKHALRNAAVPLLTVLGLQVGALLTGTVITETIFDWPGIGTLLLDSINRRDYPLVQGCVLIIALTYVFVNILTDILYAVVNPRVRLS